MKAKVIGKKIGLGNKIAQFSVVRALRRETREIDKEYRKRRYITYRHAEGGGPRTCCPSATNSVSAYWRRPLPQLGSTAPLTSGAPPCSPCSSHPPEQLLGYHTVRKVRGTHRVGDHVVVCISSGSCVVVMETVVMETDHTAGTKQETKKHKRK